MSTTQTEALKEAASHMANDEATTARDYHKLAERLEVLAAGEWQGQLGGMVSGYPFFVMRRQFAAEAPTVLLTAGMHGDEPAGVEAALQWMESDDWRQWQLNWLVLPCINPSGWTHDRRTNAEGQDINRHFLAPDQCPEAEIVRQVVGRQHFLLAMDLHEDSESDGYYLCETKVAPPFFGEHIPQILDSLLPVADDATLDSRRAQGTGWVLRLARRNAFERRRTWPLGFHLAACCTDHFLCSETPVGFPLSVRVRAHLTVLNEGLRFATSSLRSFRQPAA